MKCRLMVTQSIHTKITRIVEILSNAPNQDNATLFIESVDKQDMLGEVLKKVRFLGKNLNCGLVSVKNPRF